MEIQAVPSESSRNYMVRHRLLLAMIMIKKKLVRNKNMHRVSSAFLSDTEVESVYAESMILNPLQYTYIYTSQTLHL